MKVVRNESKEKNLLIFADFDCDTGFGKVSKELVNEWSKDSKLKIVVFAINNYQKEAYQYKENVLVIPASSTYQEKDPKGDLYFRLQFLRLLYNNDFDVVFYLNDIEVFNDMGEHLKNVKIEKKKNNKPSFKSIVYFPIDSEPRVTDLQVLNLFDEIVTYTDYAKEVVKRMVAPTISKKIKVIPHGTNTDDFYPLEKAEKQIAKIELLGEEFKDTYLFGSVNRNSARKDLATLILGFAYFKNVSKEPINAVLYLHCNPTDKAGINVQRLCERLGLRFGIDVVTPKDFNENKGYDLAKLNKIYNAFDCFITTTTAEGWGLTITEAMATKCLVICPKHTSITEITNNGENTLNFLYSTPMVFVKDYEKLRYVCSGAEVKTLMEVAYNLKNEEPEIQEVIKTKIENAYNKVSGWKWKDISKQFKTIIDKLAK
jgi:glycosyltransferase involved in cell wall biosynthesis